MSPALSLHGLTGQSPITKAIAWLDRAIPYSERSEFTGFAIAALIDR